MISGPGRRLGACLGAGGSRSCARRTSGSTLLQHLQGRRCTSRSTRSGCPVSAPHLPVGNLDPLDRPGRVVPSSSWDRICDQWSPGSRATPGRSSRRRPDRLGSGRLSATLFQVSWVTDLLHQEFGRRRTLADVGRPGCFGPFLPAERGFTPLRRDEGQLLAGFSAACRLGDA